MFDIENPFGADAFTKPASESYRTTRKAPKRRFKKPTPPSTLLKNFLLS